ncbi:MAG: hypothetical protein LBB81_06745 [Treponema sp.]|jgi:hypothetical protein|nr:hypothetical protein [Treponema sp.]
MRIKTNLFFLIITFSLALVSCNAGISGPLDAKGSAAFTVNMSLQPRITDLIRRLNAAGGSQQAGILNAAEIARSIKEAPGVETVALMNTAPNAVEGRIKITRVSDFLAGKAGVRFIEFNQSPGGGNCVLNISRRSAPEILSLLSPEIRDYLEILMAPVVTGEDISRPEYLALVSSFYNKAVSDEIASSRINAVIDFPGQVSSVKGGTFSGSKAVFDIPLADLLVLETPLSYEVKWK